MGRSAAPERAHVRKSGQNKVQCKYCGLEFADSVKKIKAHLAFEWHDGMRGITVCDKCPDQKRRAIQNTADNEFRTKQKKKRSCTRWRAIFLSGFL